MNIERAPTPKRMLPEKLIYLSMRGASPVDQTGGAFLFSLISLVEKGKQCNEQAPKGNQQADNPQENHNGLVVCHMHHLPSYVFRRTGFHWLGRLPPCHGYSSMRVFYHLRPDSAIGYFPAGKCAPKIL